MRKLLTNFFIGGIAGKLLGIGREMLMAALYGTSAIAVACRLGLACITIPAKFLTSESQTGVFLPLFLQKWRDERTGQAMALFFVFLCFTMVPAIVIALSLYFTPNFWIQMLAPGVQGESYFISVQFLQVLALGLPVFVGAVTFSSIELARGNSVIAATQASIQSIGVIAGATAAYLCNNALILAWSINIAWCFHLVIALLRTRKYFSLFSWKRCMLHGKKLVKDFSFTLLPLLPVPFFIQMNLIVERVVASYISTSTIPALDYARFICESGMALVAMPLGYAVLSHLHGIEVEQLKEKLFKTLKPIVLWGSIGSFWCFASAEFIVKTLLQRGNFSSGDTELTASILAWSILGLWAHVSAYVLARALNVTLQGKKYTLAFLCSTCVSIAVTICFWPILGSAILGVSYLCYSLTLLVITLFMMDMLREFLKKYFILLLPAGGLFLLYCFNFMNIQKDIWVLSVVTISTCCCLFMLKMYKRRVCSLKK